MAISEETVEARGHFSKASVRDARVAGKRVLVRADFNVPLDHGIVKDDARIRAAVPTIELLREAGAAVVLCSHLGRPEDRDPDLSMAPVAARLAELIGAFVAVAPDVVGDSVEGVIASLDPGEVLLLENTRFEPGETSNDAELAEALAGLADLYVNDAFGAAHRAHASTEGVAHHLPAYAGLLLEREVRELTSVLDDPDRPLVVVIGGAKVSDKIGVINRFLEIADQVLIGGAMCFSFFRAQGHGSGNSLVEEEGIELARDLLERAEKSDCELLLPTDLVLGEGFSAEAVPRELAGVDVPDGMMGLDIGEKTAARFADVIAKAGTVFWNGPMGAFELQPFAAGTRAVAEAVAGAKATTIVGGGDSGAALAQLGLADQVSWLSTGGGASLELLEGRELPGVEALLDSGSDPNP
ncbi:MAG: phosphoglycerate kinase [Thermoleophilia bacterium]|nr:phosphoglycerate kinase [Thermoleophilia bacterium]